MVEYVVEKFVEVSPRRIGTLAERARAQPRFDKASRLRKVYFMLQAARARITDATLCTIVGCRSTSSFVSCMLANTSAQAAKLLVEVKCRAAPGWGGRV